jgi:hypothetical protein
LKAIKGGNKIMFGIKDSANLTVISNATNKVVIYADYCNKTDISFTADTVYAMKKGVKAIGWDNNREGTFTTEFQVFDLKWLGLLMGSEFTTGVTTLNKREVKPVTSASATLSATPKAGSLTIFKLDTDGITQLTEQTVGTPATTPNTYSISGATVTLNSTTWATDGKIVAYYLVDSEATATSFKVTATDFPTGYTIIGDTKIKSDSNVEKMVQFRMNNVKPKSNMTLSMNSDDVTTLSIEWDIFADTNNDMFIFKTL